MSDTMTPDTELVFTDAAARKVGELIREEGNPNLMLRVFVSGGGEWRTSDSAMAGWELRRLRSDEPEEGKMPGRVDMLQRKLTERTFAIVDEVNRVAQETGRTAPQVSLNWLLQKPGVTSPIIGARTLRQLEDNLGCLDFTLSREQMRRLDEVSRVDLGFPMEFITGDMVKEIITGGAKIG